MTEGATEKPRLEIDWARTIAGALAAVTAAVLLSTLGAVGTLIGAAVGSVAATVGTAIYAQGLARSKQAVAKAQETALGRIGAAQAEVRRAQRRGTDTRAHLDEADDELASAQAELEEAAEDPVPEERPGWRERLADLPWKRIALLAAAMFVVALLAITAFEQLAGRSVSSYTGGSDDRRTTIFGGDEDDAEQRRDRDDRSPEPTEPESKAPVETEGPTEQPTAVSPEEPSETDTTPEPTPTDPPPISTPPLPSPTG